MAEQIDRSVHRHAEQRFTVQGLAYRTDIHAGIHGVRGAGGLHHPAVADDHDGGHLSVGRQVTLDDGVGGPLALQRRIPVEINFTDPRIAPDLFIGVRTLDRVEAFKGGTTNRRKPVWSGETSREIGREGVQGGTSEPVQTTGSPCGNWSGQVDQSS
jgi:hypothetical protein